MLSPPVLIVDDNVDLAENLAELVESEGREAVVFADSTRALAWARGNPFALALLDVRMPGLDGLELWRELREVRPGAPCMFVTAMDDDERVVKTATANQIPVVAKPFDTVELLARVRAALDHEPSS